MYGFYMSQSLFYLQIYFKIRNKYMVFVLSESKCDSLGQQTEKNSRNTWNSQNANFLLNLIVLLNKNRSRESLFTLDRGKVDNAGMTKLLGLLLYLLEDQSCEFLQTSVFELLCQVSCCCSPINHTSGWKWYICR